MTIFNIIDNIYIYIQTNKNLNNYITKKLNTFAYCQN